MIEFASFLLFVVGLAISITINIYLYFKNKRMFKLLESVTLEKIIIMQKLQQELESKDSNTIEQTDGFLKFVSQSRDWAFQYIEDAQDKLVKFSTDLNDILTSGKNKKEISQQILEAYKPIKELLPDEQGEK